MTELEKANKTICKELNKKEEYYKAFVQTVLNVLEENGVCFLPFTLDNNEELAEKIVDRIAGCD